MRRLIWKAPLIIALVSFAAWWQLKHNTERGVGKVSTAANSHLSSALAGSWDAEVSYGSSERHREQFFFQPEGDRLFGTASFLGTKRGIEDGKITASTFSFYASFDEIMNGAPQLRRNRYEGGIDGDGIHLKVFDEGGNPPVEFTLAKSGSAGGGSAAGK